MFFARLDNRLSRLRAYLSVLTSFILISTGVIAGAISNSNASGTAGLIDTTFGTNGFTITSTGPSSQINAIAIDSSGRIVVGGTSQVGGNNVFTVGRYLANGTLDTTFGTNGFTTTTRGTDDSINALAIDSSGRIIAGGYATEGGSPVFALARYLPSGAVDTTFAANGFSTYTPGDSDEIESIALDSSGNIVVAGKATIGGNSGSVIGKFTSTGAYDSTFGTSGFSSFISNSIINSILIDTSGRIVAGGYKVVGGNNAFFLTRYNSSGTIDSSFGTSGSTVTTPGTSDVINSVALDNSQNIYAAGSATIGGVTKFAIARYTTNGSIDNSFGTSGFITSTPGTNDSIKSIILDTTGAIVAGGTATVSGNNAFELARYSNLGVLDNTFGTNGFSTSTPGSDDSLGSISIDSSGLILVGGTTISGGNNSFVVSRFTGNYGPIVIKAPTPVNVPPPPQQSQITSISPTSAVTLTPTPIVISGKFVEPVSNISINNKALALGTWHQTGSTISFTLPAEPTGNYSIQLFNGSAPTLPEVDVTVSPAPTPSASPSPTPTPAPTPTVSPTPTTSATPTVTPTPVPSSTSTPSPSPSPSSPNPPTPTYEIDTPIYFTPSTFSLGKLDKHVIDSLASQFKNKTILKITVTGYADAAGMWWNQQLSEFRAKSVAKYLIAKGFTHISMVQGSGPIPTKIPAIAKSRRVDIAIQFVSQ